MRVLYFPSNHFQVLGIIGALDPYTHKVFTGKVSSQRSNSLALSLPATSSSSDMRNGVFLFSFIAEFNRPKFEQWRMKQMFQLLASQSLYLCVYRAITSLGDVLH